MTKVPFGLIEMQKFAEQSDDERIKVMWSKICDYRKKIAIWNEAMVKMRAEFDQLRSDAEAYRALRRGLAEDHKNSLGKDCGVWDSRNVGQ